MKGRLVQLLLNRRMHTYTLEHVSYVKPVISSRPPTLYTRTVNFGKQVFRISVQFSELNMNIGKQVLESHFNS